MSSSSGNSQSVTRRRRHGRDLPVLRWLQVGTAATGVSVALLAAPGLAAADEGNAASGADSTTKSAEPHRGTAGTARTRANAPKTTSSATRGSSKRPNPLGVVQHSADPTETDSKTETPSAATTPAATSAQTPAPGSSTVQTAQSAVTIRWRKYPDPVTAPVTVRAIVDDTLDWIGFKDFAPTVPVPDAPVPDLIAAAWVGVRRFHYTFFNSTPILTAQTYTKDPETGVITGSVKSYDADGDVIKYRVNGQPSHGAVTVNEDGTYTYTPDAAYAHAGGTDSFTITATDSAVNPFHTNVIDDLIHALNHALTALGIATIPTSAPNKQTLTVAVGPANHAPELTASLATADAETGTRVITTATGDSDGDTVTVTVSSPNHGTLTDNSDGTYTYTPEAAFAHTGGTDTLTLTATDSTGATATQVLSITTTPINHNPTVTASPLGAAGADGSRLIAVNTSDPDADPVTITTTASHGTLTALSANELNTLGLAGLTPGTTVYRYTPETTFAHTGGTDTLTFTATDTLPSGSTGPAITTTLAVTTAAINHNPTVTASPLGAAGADGSRLIAVNTSDPDADPVTITTTASHGTLTALSANELNTLGLAGLTPGTTVYRYTPETTFAHTGGTDTLTFTATDNYDAAATTQLAVTVAAVSVADVTDGLPPSAFTPFTTSGTSSSPDSESVAEAFDGAVSTKYLNFAGPGSGVTIDLGAGNQAVVNGLGLTTANDFPGRDPSSYELYGSADGTTFALISSGQLAPPTERFTAYPDVTFVNTTAYRYYRLVFPTVLSTDDACEGGQCVQIAEIRLPQAANIAPINHSPTVTASPLGAASADGSRLITVSATDPDADPVTITTTASHGTLSVLSNAEKAELGLTTTAPVYRYTPETTFAHTGGTDTLTFTATDTLPNDTTGPAITTTLAVSTAPINQSPTVQSVSVGAGDSTTGAVAGTVSGSDADGDTLTYSAPATTTGGTVTMDPTTGAFTYIPNDSGGSGSSATGLFGGKFGQSQVLDVATSPGCGTLGATCTVSAFHDPYVAPWPNRVLVTWADGDYVQFVDTGSVIAGHPNIQLIQYASDGVQKRVISANGYVKALSEGVLYIGQPNISGGTGYFVSNAVGIDRATQDHYTFTVTNLNPTALDLANYDANSTPLEPGQAAHTDSFVVTISDGHGGSTTTTVTVPIVRPTTAAAAQEA